MNLRSNAEQSIERAAQRAELSSEVNCVFRECPELRARTVGARSVAYATPTFLMSASNLGSERRLSNVPSMFSQAIQTSRSS